MGSTTILSQTAGIVDTGTTLILIASGQSIFLVGLSMYLYCVDAFATYQSITGGVEDSTTGLLRITPDQFANLPPLDFNIGGTTFSLSANAQIWPVRLCTSQSCLSADPKILFTESLEWPNWWRSRRHFLDRR